MDYEDLDSVLARRNNVGQEQLARKSGYNEQTVAASFDVQGLKAYETRHDVGARKVFPGREVEAGPHSDVLSVVYASVNRANRSGLSSSSSQQTDESNQFLYSQIDRNLGYDVQREDNEWDDNKARALYSTVQRKSGQPEEYPGCGFYDTGLGDSTNNSYRYSEHGYGNVNFRTHIDRDGIYSFIQTESPDEGFHSTINDASLGRYHSRNDRGIYEFEQPVVTPQPGEYIHDVNPGYCEFQELHAGANCGDFGYGSRPFDTLDSNTGIYSFIRSDSAVEDEHHANPRGNGDGFLSRDVLQIALGNSLKDMSLTGALCTRCQQGFSKDEEIVNSSGQIWHTKCFVCAQCFQQFPEGIFYEFEGRKYCEHDFNVLFAPCCGQCKEFIIGRVIKAMNCNWHPDCFVCQLCNAPLADAGFIKNAGRALCRECNTKEKARGTGKYVCHKCHSIIEEGMIKYKGEAYHPYHFNCTTCSVELNADAREKGGELYCLRCHDKMGIPICGACRRPIEERVVYALGKSYHVEHFVCAKCEKPFLGTRHYEKKGLAYCETHYHQLFGNICFVCNCVVAGDVFTALNKAWCVDHFACSVCDRKMSQKTKFFEVDLKPVCKACYEKFPPELKKRLKKAYDQQTKK